MVDDLAVSDRSPSELADHFELPTNLLAHHLDVLERAGVIERFRSTGDQRRRYVRLVPASLHDLVSPSLPTPERVVFVCTHNSARSQLAAALWQQLVGPTASSAGTQPAERVHPDAVTAGRRHGLDLSGAVPHPLDDADRRAMIITVCDRAHEQLVPSLDNWHWSIPDPVDVGTDDAFDRTVAQLDYRIRTLI